MKIKIKKLDPNAKIPSKAHDSDFCYDVYATSCEEIEPGIWKYGLGFCYEIERDAIWLNHFYDEEGIKWGTYIPSKNFEDIEISIDFRPRSSVWKTGMVLSNCVGTLDELYRGEVMAFFYEVIPGKEKYKVGDRIGQIKLGFTLPMEFIECDIDTNTERGEGGFGSTGR